MGRPHLRWHPEEQPSRRQQERAADRLELSAVRAPKGYVQAYTGYAESLIDGNHYSNRIGLGLMLTDWF